MSTAQMPDTHISNDRFILRFHDEGMRKHLKVRAALNERTLNAEILYLIKRGLAAEGDALHATARQEATQ